MAQTKRTWIIAALIALVATLVGVGIWSTQRGDDESTSDALAKGEKLERSEVLQRKRQARLDAEQLERVGVGGRVTRADDGSGIAGAVVLLSRKDMVTGQAPRPGEPTLPLSTITDANGGWQIDAVDPGRYRVSATALGFIPVTDEVRIAGRGEQTGINLAMVVGGALLSGTISDIGGGPIEGVLVRINETSQLNLGFTQVPMATISDENGEYRVQLRTGSYNITTFHTDYVAEARWTHVPESGRRENFELIPGGTIEGVVLARPDGTPVPGARVTYSDSRNEGFGGNTNMSFDGSLVVADDEGRFRLTGVRAGVVGLMAASHGHASVTPEEVAIGIGEQVSGVELWVDTAYTISGFVAPKDDPEGAIEGVLVGAWMMQPFSLLVANAPSASDGYFEIVGVRPGNWQVGAVGEEHLLALSGATANVTDHDITDLLIELETGLYVRGHVDPGVRARVRVELSSDNISITNIGKTMADALANTTADETGAFELGPLSPGGFGGRELKILVDTDEGYRGEQLVKLGRDDLEGVVVSMTKGASVSGTVLDENGVPQRGVAVSITPVEPKPNNEAISFGASGGSTLTSEDGRYSVRGLDLGKHLVVVKDGKGRPMSWAKGSGPAPAEGEAESREVPPLEIELVDTVNDQILDLRVVPRDATIAGVVLDAEGLPVADAWVRASLDMDRSEMWRPSSRDKTEYKTGVVPKDEDAEDEPDWTRSTHYSEPPVLSDQAGFFVIKDLRRDRNYHLIAEGERGGARATLESVVPNTRVTLTLEQLSGIDGVVTLDGKPVEEYQVELTGPTRREKRVSHPKGEFELDRLDPGSYELFVSAKLGTGEAKVELGESGRANVTIELERGGTLRGQVVGDKDGEPIAGLRIMVMSSGRVDPTAGIGMLTGQGPQTDRDGRFEVTNVAPGKGTLTFMDPDVSLSSGAVAVAELEFELDPGAEEDLGTIKGIQGDSVPKDERGSLQMHTRQATWAKRPRPPDTDLEAEEPNEEAQADPSTRLWVWSVEVGGVAEQAGVEPGDEIVTIDGQAVASMGVPMAANLLLESRLRVGQDVRLELLRGDGRVDVSLKAAPRKP